MPVPLYETNFSMTVCAGVLLDNGEMGISLKILEHDTSINENNLWLSKLLWGVREEDLCWQLM